MSNSGFTHLNSLVLLGPLMTSATPSPRPLHTFPVVPAPKASDWSHSLCDWNPLQLEQSRPASNKRPN